MTRLINFLVDKKKQLKKFFSLYLLFWFMLLVLGFIFLF